MTISMKELTRELKLARERKGFSQRSYAQRINIPQGRLSKIENGLIDIRASNLLELARSLDFELMLIPRQIVPMVNSLIREVYQSETGLEDKPLYSLDDKASYEDQEGENSES